jgi:hypothetical protein
MPSFSAILRAVLMPLYSPCRADAAIFAERRLRLRLFDIDAIDYYFAGRHLRQRQLTPPILMLR